MLKLRQCPDAQQTRVREVIGEADTEVLKLQQGSNATKTHIVNWAVGDVKVPQRVQWGDTETSRICDPDAAVEAKVRSCTSAARLTRPTFVK